MNEDIQLKAIMAFTTLLQEASQADAPGLETVLEWIRERVGVVEVTNSIFGGVLNCVIASPLSSEDKLDLTKALVDMGAVPQGGCEFRSPISHAAHAGEVGIAAYLLTKIQVPFEWEGEDDPLVGAIVSGSLDIVKMLVSAGMNPAAAKGSETMITLARKWGRKDVENFLLQASSGSAPQNPERAAQNSVEELFGPIRKSINHALLGVSVLLTDNGLITEGLGGVTPDGLRVEFYLEVEPTEDLEGWPLSLILSGVASLRSGKSVAADMGEIVPLAKGASDTYSHLLLLRDSPAGDIQLFRGVPLYKEEASAAVSSGVRWLLTRFQELGVSTRTVQKRPSAV